MKSIVKIVVGSFSSCVLQLQVEGSLCKSPRELYGSSGNKKSICQEKKEERIQEERLFLTELLMLAVNNVMEIFMEKLL